MKENKIIQSIYEDGRIVYSFMLNDRNLIVYFTYEINKSVTPAPTAEKTPEPSPTFDPEQGEEKTAVKKEPVKSPTEFIKVYTYNIDKKEKTEHQSFGVSGFSEIKQIEYSYLTNLMYVNVKSMEKSRERDRIMRIDIMKNVSTYAQVDDISNMVLLRHEDTLFYEDKHHNIYQNLKRFSLNNKEELKLLGVDDKDLIYLQSIEDPKRIYQVKKQNHYQSIRFGRCELLQGGKRPIRVEFGV